MDTRAAASTNIGVFIRPDSRAIKAIREKISGILRHAAERPEWSVRFLDTPDEGTIPGRKFDGAIFLGGLPRHPARLCRSYVAVDTMPCTVGSIAVDDRDIATRAANFLMQRGYRSLAFVGTSRPGLAQYSRARCKAFEAAATANGLQAIALEIDETADFGVRFRQLVDFLTQLEMPCGVMACADEIARDVLDACRLAHLRVPDQIAIIGVDNELEICETMRPSISSVYPDFERCGYMAARMLARTIRDGQRHPTGKYAYGVRAIVERASTLDLRGGGRLVALAMEIIRKKACHGLTVARLADELHTSQRLLEIRFKEILGASCKQKILDIRIDRALQLLVVDTCPIGDISRLCGWQSDIALKVLFKRRFGISMLAYRRKHLVTRGQ